MAKMLAFGFALITLASCGPVQDKVDADLALVPADAPQVDDDGWQVVPAEVWAYIDPSIHAVQDALSH